MTTQGLNLFAASPLVLAHISVYGSVVPKPEKKEAEPLAHLQNIPTDGPDVQSAGVDSEASQQQEGHATCLTCGIIDPPFTSTNAQREHFKTDWHRLNVKRKVTGQAAVSEDVCERILSQQRTADDDDDASSLSGSDSDSDDDEDGPSHRRGATHVEPRTVFQRNPQAEESSPLAVEEPSTSTTTTEVPGQDTKTSTRKKSAAVVPLSMYYSVWNCVLYQEKASRASRVTDGLAESLRSVSQHKRWGLVMNRGGHFAAAVFEFGKPTGRGGTEWARVVEHKSFHRYIVRQGQGSRQATQDKTGKFAKSAGSQIRRHNEVALERDILTTLAEWEGLLKTCDLVFVHAPSANSKAVMGSEAGRIDASDPRIRRIPFTTRRPTFKELKRCLNLLATLEPVEEPQQPKPSQPRPESSKPKAPESTAPSEPGTAHVKAVIDDGSTPLHKQSKAGQLDKVIELLDTSADPTVKDCQGRTPYQVATDKPVRDAFRKYMAKHPDQWDYAAAQVPSPLTEEMAGEQESKKAAKKAKMREKERARKVAAAEKKKAAAGVSAADAAEDEIARATIEAQALASKMYNQKKGSKTSEQKSAQRKPVGRRGKKKLSEPRKRRYGRWAAVGSMFLFGLHIIRKRYSLREVVP